MISLIKNEFYRAFFNTFPSVEQRQSASLYNGPDMLIILLFLEGILSFNLCRANYSKRTDLSEHYRADRCSLLQFNIALGEFFLMKQFCMNIAGGYYSP